MMSSFLKHESVADSLTTARQRQVGGFPSSRSKTLNGGMALWRRVYACVGRPTLDAKATLICARIGL
jgi:hypothetical protein